MFYLYYLLYKLTNNHDLWIVGVYDNYEDIREKNIKKYVSDCDSYIIVKRQFYISKNNNNNRNNRNNNTYYYYSWNSFSNKNFNNSSSNNSINSYTYEEIYDTFHDDILILRKKKVIQKFIEDVLNIKNFNKFILNDYDDIIIQKSIIV